MRIGFFGGAISTEEPDLAMFQYNEQTKIYLKNAGIRKFALNI